MILSCMNWHIFLLSRYWLLFQHRLHVLMTVTMGEISYPCPNLTTNRQVFLKWQDTIYRRTLFCMGEISYPCPNRTTNWQVFLKWQGTIYRRTLFYMGEMSYPCPNLTTNRQVYLKWQDTIYRRTLFCMGEMSYPCTNLTTNRQVYLKWQDTIYRRTLLKQGQCAPMCLSRVWGSVSISRCIFAYSDSHDKYMTVDWPWKATVRKFLLEIICSPYSFIFDMGVVIPSKCVLSSVWRRGPKS